MFCGVQLEMERKKKKSAETEQEKVEENHLCKRKWGIFGLLLYVYWSCIVI